MDEKIDIVSAVTDEEAELLSNLAAGKFVLEIGTEFGKSTIAMARTAKLVYAVDHHHMAPKLSEPWDVERCVEQVSALLRNLRKYNVAEKVIPVIGDCGKACSYLAPGSFDMLFIDADHTYTGVRHSLWSAIGLLVAEPIIAFHDYGRCRPEYDWHVTEIVDCLAEEWNAHLTVVGHLAAIQSKRNWQFSLDGLAEALRKAKQKCGL
jgi:hypothetical protein